MTRFDETQLRTFAVIAIVPLILSVFAMVHQWS